MPRSTSSNGHRPGLFSEKNLTISDGKLHLTMRKEQVPAEYEKRGYHDYTCAVVRSTTKVLYGYFEVRAKAMNSAGSSSFWFAGSGDGWRTEIDVFEISGNGKGFEQKYNMHLHVFYTPTEQVHWNVGDVWLAPWRLADDYHVYGLDWNENQLTYYVDGVAVWRLDNTHWRKPLSLILDCQTLTEWFGLPEEKDLPSTFNVDYVRAWKSTGGNAQNDKTLQPATSAAKPDERVAVARTLVAQMAAGKFSEAVEPFDEVMKKALPSDKLQAVWGSLVKQHGPLERTTETRTEKIQQYRAVYVTCPFQRGLLDAKVVFNSNNKISGLFFVPAGKYKPPDYADFSKFEEKEISIGKGLFALPGTWALPKGDGPFPAVVLVHGSGPHDRDETIGPNKPFRDLAHGLASRGIAVLRYEKRTKQHPILMALAVSSITVKEETVDDAVAAVETLAAQGKIDPKRIVVLGHSLGGMLIPRIGKAKDGIAGFISLAGSTRPLEDVVLEQTKYILSLHGKPTDEEQGKLRELERQVAKAKSPQLAEDTPKSELPLGVPAKYLLDLRGYEPAKEAIDLRKPMLILQGERDYQVTMADFANWKMALGSRQNVQFISYPKLNHLFVEGEGKSAPTEYAAPGNVAKVVIDDIAKWIEVVKP